MFANHQSFTNVLPSPNRYTSEQILSLRPTQFSVGMREVLKKQEKIAGSSARSTTIPPMPVLLGPERQLYLLDRHHYALALYRMGVKRADVEIVGDLSHLDAGNFWLTLALRSWARPIDGTGMRRQYMHMPTTILGLENDPFRSLAGELRRLGVFAKTLGPYADFAWADFLRYRMRGIPVEQDFDAARREAIDLVQTDPEARQLPGWKQFAQSASPPEAAVEAAAASLSL